MKTAIALLILAAATLPTLSYASTEMISAERGHYCDVVTNTVVIGQAKPDPMQQKVDALVASTNDPVLQSYYRDLYRADPTFPTEQFITRPDPYVEAITLALYGSVEPDARLVC